MPRFLLVVLLCLFALPAATPEPYDLLLVGGRVLDGTGNPAFYADVAIEDGRIVAIGRLRDRPAARVIDVTGHYIAPGFIDLHSHADDPNYGPSGLRAEDPLRRAAPNLVAQGVTTVVVNHDGRSVYPLRDQRQALERLGTGPNVALMVGHNSIRREALGPNYRRRATPEEIERMRAMIREGMDEGAWGLTAGLEYTPGKWSDQAEVEALAAIVAERDGVMVVHERASGADPMWYLPSRDSADVPTFLDNIAELIDVSEKTGVRMVATHAKARGANYWGSSRAAIQMINRARERGVDMWADQYPYNTTGSDGSTVLIPDWALGQDRWSGGQSTDNGTERSFAQRLADTMEDAGRTAALRRDIAHEINRRGGPENIVVMDYPDEALVGQSVQALSETWAIGPVDVAIRLQMYGANRPGGAHLRGYSLSEIDVELYAQEPWMVTASDGGIALPEDGFVHARFYGTFPRKIAYYARERGLLSVPDAVRSMTSLPARLLGMRDRGQVREGFAADLVVFDPLLIRDMATFFEPHQYPDGIAHVLVGGTFVVEDGRLTNKLAGKILDR